MKTAKTRQARKTKKIDCAMQKIVFYGKIFPEENERKKGKRIIRRKFVLQEGRMEKEKKIENSRRIFTFFSYGLLMIVTDKKQKDLEE